MSSQQNVIFYSLCNLNLQLIFFLILEHSPGWIIDESRRQWILYAIETKDLAFLRILSQTVVPFINTCEYLEFAAGIEDNIPVMEYLLSFNFPVDELKVLKSAVEKKALKNLKFLHEKKRFCIDDNYHLFIGAAGTEDNIEVMEYLKSHHCPIVHLDTSRSAARHGALNNLKWLFDNGCSMDDSDIFDDAISHGSLEVLKWLKSKECPIIKGWNYGAISWENCSIESLEWLLDQGAAIDPRHVFRASVKHVCLDQMKWIVGNFRMAFG